MSIYNPMESKMDNMYEANPQFAEFCTRLGAQPQEIPTQTVGSYQIADPGVKDMKELIDKMWRKMYEENCSQEFVNEHKVFNLISDYARCSVLLPDFTKAPKLLQRLIQSLGGEITIHNRPVYKAFHLHTQRAGINCEIQLHTPETFALKKMTALKYEKWRKPLAEKPAETKSNLEYQEESALEEQLCADIYARSGFDNVLPEVAALKPLETAIAPMQTKELLIIMSRAEKVQEDLINILQDMLMQLENEKSFVEIPSVDALHMMLDTKTR